MPHAIKVPNIKENCGCYHDKSELIRKTLTLFKSFLETKSLFKIGEKVQVAVDLNLNYTDSPGWMGQRHFLIKGAEAEVVEIEYYDNEFRYLLQFDNDISWIDEKDVIHLNSDPTRRHNFCFRESKLKKAGSNISCEFLKKLWYDFYRIGD
jgi:hypothetical protein